MNPNNARLTELVAELRRLKAASTEVNAWYAHEGDDCHGPEATIRGPFARWFRCSDVLLQYNKYVAPAINDVRYAAAAMTAVPELLDAIEEQVREIDSLRAQDTGPSVMRQHDILSGVINSLSTENARLRETLELIAAPKRNDGTYNRCREACEQLAKQALKGEVST